MELTVQQTEFAMQVTTFWRKCVHTIQQVVIAVHILRVVPFALTELSRLAHKPFRTPQTAGQGRAGWKSAATGDIAMKISGIRLLGAMLCLALSGVVAAQDANPIRITNSVFQEIEVKAAGGATSTRLVPADKVVPGGEVVYRIDVSNNGDAVATDIAINNAVPAEMVLSSEPNPAPSVVSVDGGETFGALTGLSVVGADGASRDAQLTDITNLRWVIQTLAPGAKTQVVYRARLK